MTHTDQHQLAGQTVTLPSHPDDPIGSEPAEYIVEDWYDRLTGGSWMTAQGNPAALKFALRTGLDVGLHGQRVPTDDEVVYGHIDGMGHIIHDAELGGLST